MSGKITISSQWKDISDMFIVKSGEWVRATEVYVTTSGQWKQWYLAVPARLVTGGGYITSNTPFNILSYNTITTLGDSMDFGDQYLGRGAAKSASNGINQRGFWEGGWTNASTNVIDYITINSTSDASYFGDQAQKYYYAPATSNDTNDRGVWGGGWNSNYSLDTNRIEYITITSTSNGTDFGDCVGDKYGMTACSNGINERGIFTAGRIQTGTYYNVIQYITINSTGNATNASDLNNPMDYGASTDNGVNERGITSGGEIATSTYINVIDYFTINSLGNATDFGDLSVAKDHHSAESNRAGERALFIAGVNFSGSNVIEYITINTTGDTSDFGDLTGGYDPYSHDSCSG